METGSTGSANLMDEFFAQEFRMALLNLAKSDNSRWEDTIKRITRIDAETLKVERVSVWLYDRKRSAIVCECLYKSSASEYEKGLKLKALDYPRYFQAMEGDRTVAAADAVRDPRTSEFAEGYLVPLEISSMMDVPIRLHGKVIGVVCHEHTGPLREWTTYDQEFAASIADFVSLSYEASRRRKIESRLKELQRELKKLKKRKAKR